MVIRGVRATALWGMLVAVLVFSASSAAAQDQAIAHFGKNRLRFATVEPFSLPDATGTGIIDYKGGREPDTVTINVPGLPDAGLAQCASWAGDGSHRIPMMERANQTPAFDTVRIRVRAGQQAADAAAN